MYQQNNHQRRLKKFQVVSVAALLLWVFATLTEKYWLVSLLALCIGVALLFFRRFLLGLIQNEFQANRFLSKTSTSPKFIKFLITIMGIFAICFGFIFFFRAPSTLQRLCEQFEEKIGTQITLEEIQESFPQYNVSPSPSGGESQKIVYRIIETDGRYIVSQHVFWPPECYIEADKASGQILEAFYFWD